MQNKPLISKTSLCNEVNETQVHIYQTLVVIGTKAATLSPSQTKSERPPSSLYMRLKATIALNASSLRSAHHTIGPPHCADAGTGPPSAVNGTLCKSLSTCGRPCQIWTSSALRNYRDVFTNL